MLAVALGFASNAHVTNANAAEALFLTWDDCAQGAASSNKAFACNTNTGADELICAFTMPQAANNIVSIEAVVDMQHADATLPDWWRMDTGGCRAGSELLVSADFTGKTACADMWGTATRSAMVQGYSPGSPRNGTNQARIKVTAWVLPQDAVAIDGTSMYYAVRLIINHGLTVGTPSCAGCSEGSCLVLNSILIGRVSGGDYFLQTPGAGDANWARWQGGGGADCAAVPVRARAWGQLKSQYRQP